jgi:hypothetical protein
MQFNVEPPMVGISQPVGNWWCIAGGRYETKENEDTGVTAFSLQEGLA